MRDLLALGAVMRSAQMAGALQRILEASVRYAGERVQFGRPIGRFQAVQQNLAVLAGHAAAATAAAEAAIEAAAQDLAALPIAAAKIRAGEAAGIGAAIAPPGAWRDRLHAGVHTALRDAPALVLAR
jgi:acyl-CoA dehydrogenase